MGYPPVSSDVLSLSRFINLYRQKQLPDQLQVGGCFYHFKEWDCLLSGHGCILLPKNFLNFIVNQKEISVRDVQPLRSGDLLVIQFYRTDITEASQLGISLFQTNSDIGFLDQYFKNSQTEGPCVFDLSEIQDVQRVATSIESSHRNLHRPNEVADIWRASKKWSDFIYSIRKFFHDKNFLEINSPGLVVNPGMEPELEPFSVEWKIGSRREKLFLPTSPELALKKMMAQGLSDIFEIKSVFRNEELTALHEPEFLMLEWYRSFSNLELISRDLTELVNFLISFINITQSDKNPGTHQHVDAPPKANQSIVIQKYTVAELFEKQLGYKLTPETSREQLLYWAKELKLIDVSMGQSVQKNESRDFLHWDWNNLFYLIWVAKIEPHLPIEPFLLTNYPPSQAALARITEDGWADRMEFYWNRIEIANAFHELNDPHEQRLRFERDMLKREEYGRTRLSIDEEFMRALEQGLPPSGGIALGLERLYMALYNVREIKNVRGFRK